MITRQTRSITTGLLLMLALGATACGASPEEVCKHVEKLTTDAGETFDAKGCSFTWDMRKETLSMFEYGDKASCAMDAKTLGELDGC